MAWGFKYLGFRLRVEYAKGSLGFGAVWYELKGLLGKAVQSLRFRGLGFSEIQV